MCLYPLRRYAPAPLDAIKGSLWHLFRFCAQPFEDEEPQELHELQRLQLQELQHLHPQELEVLLPLLPVDVPATVPL